MNAEQQLQDLADAVFRMRSTQIRYFRTREASALQTSKQLEARVDKMVDAVRNRQRSLFQEDNP